MQFTKVSISASLVAAASAAVQITNTDFGSITVGVPYTITWTGATGGVDIELKSGPALVQVDAGTIANDAYGGSVVWTPTSAGTYNFEIEDDDSTNYSIQFGVSGGSSSVSASASATVASVSTVPSTTASASATASVGTSTDSAIVSSITSSVPAHSASASVVSALVSGSVISSNGSTTVSTATRSSSATGTRAPSASVSVASTNGAAQQAASFTLGFLSLAALFAMY